MLKFNQTQTDYERIAFRSNPTSMAVYGTFEAWVPVYQRYWKHRRDCITQRYWKETKRLKRVEGKGRYDI
ncbi:MAG: hypothetical protein ACUVUF_06445 [Candidatus Bathycorpusculaceae bacterium]